MVAVRHFQGPLSQSESGEEHVWYVEYDGAAACRQFELRDNRILVAPYDIPFWDLTNPTALPPEVGRMIDLKTFEAAWMRAAQNRLKALRDQLVNGEGTSYTRYFSAHLPEGISEVNLGEGQWYAQFSGGIARRQFEVYSFQTFVAPFDISFADQFEELLQVMQEQGDNTADGYTELTFAEFEALWEVHAVVRLAEIAELPSLHSPDI